MRIDCAGGQVDARLRGMRSAEPAFYGALFVVEPSEHCRVLGGRWPSKRVVHMPPCIAGVDDTRVHPGRPDCAHIVAVPSVDRLLHRSIAGFTGFLVAVAVRRARQEADIGAPLGDDAGEPHCR
eukprot:2354161-Prymnesium_polylepis.1